MDGFEKVFEGFPKQFNFSTSTLSTSIPRAKFKRSDDTSLFVWVKQEQVRNVVQISEDRFRLYFFNGNQETVVSDEKTMDEFWWGSSDDGRGEEDDE